MIGASGREAVTESSFRRLLAVIAFSEEKGGRGGGFASEIGAPRRCLLIEFPILKRRSRVAGTDWDSGSDDDQP